MAAVFVISVMWHYRCLYFRTSQCRICWLWLTHTFSQNTQSLAFGVNEKHYSSIRVLFKLVGWLFVRFEIVLILSLFYPDWELVLQVTGADPGVLGICLDAWKFKSQFLDWGYYLKFEKVLLRRTWEDVELHGLQEFSENVFSDELTNLVSHKK